MQDNAPIHSAKKTKAWFEEMAIEVMQWPPYMSRFEAMRSLDAIQELDGDDEVH